MPLRIDANGGGLVPRASGVTLDDYTDVEDLISRQRTGFGGPAGGWSVEDMREDETDA